MKALISPNRADGLLNFEKHLLDRERPWAGAGGRTLRELGYGHLAAYTRYTREHTNTLLGLRHHACVDDPLEVYLVHCALRTGPNHKGMPRWRLIVDCIGVLLADPDHPAWHGETRGAQAIAAMPTTAGSIGTLQAELLDSPSHLPCEVLEWLSEFLLYCAGPPYRSLEWNHRTEPAPGL